ncbi:MAG: hypothetical protein AAFY28_03605 [Actinomycetota bacterium]
MNPVVVLADDEVRDRVELDVSGPADREVLRLRAIDDLSGLATGRYSRPSVAAGFSPHELLGVDSATDDDTDDDVQLLGFAFTQFAMPVLANAALDFDFHPAPNLRSPRAMLPLIVRGAGRVTLIAPVSGAHEQIITVRDGQLWWGWHGDLDQVDAGHTTSIIVYRDDSVSAVLDRWGDDLAPAQRRPLATNPALGRLAYWTDNGAAYWYRTEPGRTIGESVVDVVADLRQRNVPIGAVELDSWFYPHEVPRAIADIGYPDDVPPSGAMTWTPRADAYPPTEPDGVRWLGRALDDPPLILHARHISTSSPYIDDATDWWVGELAAAPVDPTFFRRWFDDARRWGTTCIEQDWMLLFWFGVAEMRRQPGRALQWQRALNELANEFDIDLMWCMATPADLIEAAQLDRVAAIRTSDDYRFTADPALLWTWFLTVNRLAAPLGLAPFKDCFFSQADVDDSHDPIDGDPHAEVEALLSALSAGPVGIGDRLGRTDRDVVMRTCDADGRILGPDRPLALIDSCLFGAPARGERLAWATTEIAVDGAVWTYVVALNTANLDDELIDDRMALADTGVEGRRYVYNWRTRQGEVADEVRASLAPRDWALFVCCPVEDDDGSTSVTVGDPTKYATMAAAPERWERRRLSA